MEIMETLRMASFIIFALAGICCITALIAFFKTRNSDEDSELHFVGMYFSAGTAVLLLEGVITLVLSYGGAVYIAYSFYVLLVLFVIIATTTRKKKK